MCLQIQKKHIVEKSHFDTTITQFTQMNDFQFLSSVNGIWARFLYKLGDFRLEFHLKPLAISPKNKAFASMKTLNAQIIPVLLWLHENDTI